MINDANEPIKNATLCNIKEYLKILDNDAVSAPKKNERYKKSPGLPASNNRKKHATTNQYSANIIKPRKCNGFYLLLL